MNNLPKIPLEEFELRIKKMQEILEKEDIDVLFAYVNEAEPQYVRYFSDYWPSFESAGVLIPRKGAAYLLIGPESETYAKSRSKIKNIKKLLCLRESSQPDYPGAKLDTFASLIKEMQLENVDRVAIAGYSLVPKIIYDDFVSSLSDININEIVKFDKQVNDIRSIKSNNEILCLRYAYRIAEEAMKEVINNIKPGMTENQVKGIAVAKMYQMGAESEGYPFWILTGRGSNQPVSRIRNKKIEVGDLVQIQVSARYEGYVSTIGRPVVIGKASEDQKKLIEAGYLVQTEILKNAAEGMPAKKISDIHRNVLKELGFEDYILYGPVHGTGLMENEFPWIEENSEFILEKGMAFCTCLYLGNDKEQIGIRVEDGFIINDNGAELLSEYNRKVIEIL